jgi:hypothetical protein
MLRLLLPDVLQGFQQRVDIGPRQPLQPSDERRFIRQQVWSHAENHKAAHLLAQFPQRLLKLRYVASHDCDRKAHGETPGHQRSMSSTPGCLVEFVAASKSAITVETLRYAWRERTSAKNMIASRSGGSFDPDR